MASENKSAFKSGVADFNLLFFLIEGEGDGLERIGDDDVDDDGEVSGEPLGVKGNPQIPDEGRDF